LEMLESGVSEELASAVCFVNQDLEREGVVSHITETR
jgi:hypothetical protein